MYKLIERGGYLLSSVVRIVAIAKSTNSYYPTLPHKSFLQKLVDLMKWFFRYGEANTFYYLYGFDIASPSPDMGKYIDNRHFMQKRATMNQSKSVFSQALLLRDKYLFYRYMSGNGLPVPEVFAVIKNGVVFDGEMNRRGNDYLEDKRDYFIKDICGECASYVKRVDDYTAFMRLLPELKGAYILQRAIVQNQGMNRLNGKAINTLRVVTVNTNGRIYLLTALLRVGTSKTGNVDNWAAGGIAVGIEEDGTLKSDGFYKPIHGQRTQVHPDSGIVFSDFQVPY